MVFRPHFKPSGGDWTLVGGDGIPLSSLLVVMGIMSVHSPSEHRKSFDGIDKKNGEGLEGDGCGWWVGFTVKWREKNQDVEGGENLAFRKIGSESRVSVLSLR